MKKRPDTTGHIEPQPMEDIRWAETLPALQSVQEGKLIPAEKVFAWVESWGTGEELPKPGWEKVKNSSKPETKIEM